MRQTRAKLFNREMAQAQVVREIDREDCKWQINSAENGPGNWLQGGRGGLLSP